MRANEFINEGLWDTAKSWAAKKGFLGSTQQHAAMAKQIGAEEDAERIAKNEQLLSNTLLKAEQGGMIKAGASTTGKEIPDFLQIWVKNLLKNYKVNQEQQNQLNTLYNSFAQNYRGGGKLPPQGNQIFSAIETIKDMQDDSSTQAAQTTPAPASAPSSATPAQRPAAGASAFGQMAQQLGQQNKPAATPSPGGAAFGQMAQQLGQQPTSPAKRTGGKVAGQVSQTPNAIRKRQQRASVRK